MVLFDSFSYVKLMEDSTLLNFSAIFLIFMFRDCKNEYIFNISRICSANE